jgi:hypothetical protein
MVRPQVPKGFTPNTSPRGPQFFREQRENVRQQISDAKAAYGTTKRIEKMTKQTQEVPK